VARRREVALGDRYVPAVDIELRGDQQRARDLVLAVARPAAAQQQPQCAAAQAAVQVEPVRRPERGEPRRQMAHRLARLQGDDVGEVGVVGDERRHRPLGHEYEARPGVAFAQRTHQRCGEQHVADGAEADEQDRQHAANVRVRCPASPPRSNVAAWSREILHKALERG